MPKPFFDTLREIRGGAALDDPAYFDALALQPEPLLPAQRAVVRAATDGSHSKFLFCSGAIDPCKKSSDKRFRIVCMDALCPGAGECGDGYATCPHCCDD